MHGYTVQRYAVGGDEAHNVVGLLMAERIAFELEPEIDDQWRFTVQEENEAKLAEAVDEYPVRIRGR